MAERKPYSSPLREADAAATRARIVDAAARLFVRDGYVATPLRAIAEEAGVSIQTVNLQGPKSALLMAAYERALASDEGWSNLGETDTMASIIAETDNELLLDRYSTFMTAALARIAELVRVLRAAADADPTVRELHRRIEERRLLSIRSGIDFFVARGMIDPSRSDDVFALQTMLVSIDTYLSLHEAGWPPERYRKWLRGELAKLLAGDI